MSELLLSIESEGLTEVVFRANIDRVIIRQTEMIGGQKSYELWVYNQGVRIYQKRFPFNPRHFVRQVEKGGLIKVEYVYEKEITVQQAQDLFDKSSTK